ncbi:hypothetical protein Ocin01_15260 [Orchesella cincta]|uniref:C2H2-type domain-containing protein n=1 Tax=Orchesella cincta TaxID=48709 RepID=A0A1D2MEW0_ORCCI|nr:hypothetical protein Ocin01_15260 [Orchesella cincta]
MEQQSDKNPTDVISIPTDPSPPFSSLETNPSPSTSQKDSASSLGRVTNVVIPPFQRASLYYNRVRQVPTFHCQLCKRSFATHVLFENHKKFHNEDPSQQSHPFGLSLQSSAPINPGIRFVTRRFEEKQRGPSVQYELGHIGRMFIFDSHTSQQMNNTNDAVSKKYRFVCRLCPCDPTFDKEADLSIHNRRVHPIIVEGTEEIVPLEECGFCSVATDLIERIQIDVPRPPLLTQRENLWHHNNPFCTLHSTIPLKNSTKNVTNTMLESGDDAASELPPSPPDLPNASDNEAPETQHLVNGSRSDAEDENRNKDELVLVKVAQKRRNLFKGVEFFKCTSSADPSQEFWQCGICNFSLPNSKTNERTGRMTPLKKLKVHNNSFYKLRVTKVLKRLGSRKYGKNPVGKEYSSKCNVCGCPLSTSRRHILLLHKFSHMSNVERKAALARGEEVLLSGCSLPNCGIVGSSKSRATRK